MGVEQEVGEHVGADLVHGARVIAGGLAGERRQTLVDADRDVGGQVRDQLRPAGGSVVDGDAASGVGGGAAAGQFVAVAGHDGAGVGADAGEGPSHQAPVMPGAQVRGHDVHDQVPHPRLHVLEVLGDQVGLPRRQEPVADGGAQRVGEPVPVADSGQMVTQRGRGAAQRGRQQLNAGVSDRPHPRCCRA